MSKIYNVRPDTFHAPLRNGDTVATLNFLQYLRIQENNDDIKFYIPDESIFGSQYCHDFHHWLRLNTDMISLEPGEFELPSYIPLWTQRTEIQEVIKIPNPQPLKAKVCIFPLFDAPYHAHRNWPMAVANEIIKRFKVPEFDNYEKYICSNQVYDGLELLDFQYSFDFHENLNHLLECSHYVGGETGLTLFASALDNPHRQLHYFYSANAYTAPNYDVTPFHFKAGKGQMYYY